MQTEDKMDKSKIGIPKRKFENNVLKSDKIKTIIVQN